MYIHKTETNLTSLHMRIFIWESEFHKIFKEKSVIYKIFVECWISNCLEFSIRKKKKKMNKAMKQHILNLWCTKTIMALLWVQIYFGHWRFKIRFRLYAGVLFISIPGPVPQFAQHVSRAVKTFQVFGLLAAVGSRCLPTHIKHFNDCGVLARPKRIHKCLRKHQAA